MSRISVLFISFLFISCFNYSSIRFTYDNYSDFYEMVSNYVEGRDYSVEVYDRNSDVTVLAIHGGELEYKTSLVARYIADNDFNLYLFNVWLGEKSRQMHLTSTRFNDERAVLLAKKSKVALTVHAMADRGERVCVGGGNEVLREIVSDHLKNAGFKAETPCKRLPGVSENNIVNKSSEKGVQIEITISLLEKLDKNRDKLIKFSRAVKNAVFKYMNKEI